MSFMSFSNFSQDKRYSVNSSLATVKMSQKDLINEAVEKMKNRSKGRFSHQEASFNHNDSMKNIMSIYNNNSSFKENINSLNTKIAPSISPVLPMCFNHSKIEATHCALSGTEDPIYYCKRCSILIASKGFDVDPINKQYDLDKMGQRSRSEAMNGINNQKKHTFQQYYQKQSSQKQFKNNINIKIRQQLMNCSYKLQQNHELCIKKIQYFSKNIDDKMLQTDQYFYFLHEFIEKQKQIEIIALQKQKQWLKQIKIQLNQTFDLSMEKIMNFNNSIFIKRAFKEGQFFQFLQRIQQELKFNKFTEDLSIIQHNLARVNQKQRKDIEIIGKQLLELIFGSSVPKNPLKTRRSFSSLISNSENKQKSCKKPPYIPPLKINHNNTRSSNLGEKLSNSYHPSKSYDDRRGPVVRPSFVSKNIHQQSLMIMKEKQMPQNDHIPMKNDDAIQSLQLSFDEDNQQDNNIEETFSKDANSLNSNLLNNNFTLNHYINNNSEQVSKTNSSLTSYTNLLMFTSTDL